ncbi:MAG: tripartite tricarboxylate transporter substrate binding protein [Deferrisomatales bacterium]|nr:tripartite tricarboxylate transporter substrate binding protein [Deferrisomatales bacterium]
MKQLRVVLIGILVLAALGSGSPCAAADDAASFYKGNTVEFIVPNKAGGGYDTYARLMAPYLEKYTGATVVVLNKPGGGGVVGANMVYRAEPDGKTLGIMNMTGGIPAQLAGAKGIDFDLRKFGWLGRVANEPQVFVVGAESKYKTWDEILQSKETVKVSSTGTTGATYLSLLVLKMVFNMDHLDIITGFKGTTDADLSVLRGEVAGSASSVGSKLPKIKDGDFRPLLLISDEKLKELPDTPLIYDYPLSADGKAIVDAYVGMMAVARAVMTSPEVPAERLAFLREAYRKTFADPDFLEKAAKMKREISWMSGERVQELTAKSLENAPAVFVTELKNVMKK